MKATIRQPLSPYGDLARPDKLPKPACRVKLVCGPPCSGKSQYVREHARSIDTIIDLDEIALEHGFGRDRPADVVGLLLADRNRRLAGLAHKPPSHLAWVIICAPGQSLRAWWRERLNAEVILLTAKPAELIARIRADPERRNVVPLHARLVGEWFTQERENQPNRILPGCDASGWPADPLHAWNANPVP